jgi:adenylate cyclase
MATTRRLAAILAADVAGYSRLIGADEAGTLERLRALRRELLDPKIVEHRGRLVKTTGDGLLVEFGSVVDALRCAAEVQREMTGRNAGVPPDNRIEFRIGINVGDIVVEDGDIFGDGVNVAARLEGLAEPGGICVSARVQEDAAGKLDLAFEDIGEQQLKNIARTVRVFRVRPTLTLPPPSARAPSLSCNAGEGGERSEPGEGSSVLPLPDKPSIAVLPFANLSGDPEQEYFADGVVEDIITALSRVGWFFVIARNSSFAYKGKAVDIKQVGRELGVRYVLEGSIRKAANRVRITGQLIEAVTGHHIWADRFEGALDDIFDLQDRITESVVGAITPSLRRAEISRAYAKPTDSLDAYDLYLRALERHYTRQRSASDTAVALLQRAIQIDPDYALAKALLGDVYAWRYTAGWGDQEVERANAVELAREAIASNRDDPDTLRYAAHAISYFAHDHEVVLSTLDRALRLSPNAAQVLTIAGWVHLHAGDPEPAFDCFERAIRLSPLDQEMGGMLWGTGMAHLMLGRNDKALDSIQAATRAMPNYPTIHRNLAFALVRVGRIDEARQAMSRSLRLEPGWSVARMALPWRDQLFAAEMRAAFVIAGAPE